MDGRRPVAENTLKNPDVSDERHFEEVNLADK